MRRAIRDFYNLLPALWTVSNTYARVAWAKWCAIHVQHIERYHVQQAVCHVERRDSSAIKSNRV